MGRSLSFFEQIDDTAMIALLLRRLHESRDKMDVDELFEKAEMRLLQIFQYDAAHSDERMYRNMTFQQLDCEDMADIAELFMLAKIGGPIFKCIAMYAMGQTEVNETYLKLIFCLDIVGMNMKLPIKKYRRRLTTLQESKSVIDQCRCEYLLAKYPLNKEK